MPCKLTCSTKNRKQLAIEQARASLEKQVDILSMIKSRRYVHLALKHLIEPTVRKELKMRSQIQDVDSEKSASSLIISHSKAQKLRVTDLSND